MVQFFFFFLSKSHAHGVKLHRSGFNRSFFFIFIFYFVGKMAFRKNSDWRFRLPFYFISRPKGCNPGSAGGLLHTRVFKGLMPESRWLNRNFFQRRNVRTHLNRKCAVVLRMKSVGKTLWTSWYHTYIIWI